MDTVTLGNYSIRLEKGNDDVPDIVKVLSGNSPLGDRLYFTNVENGHTEIYEPKPIFRVNRE